LSWVNLLLALSLPKPWPILVPRSSKLNRQVRETPCGNGVSSKTVLRCGGRFNRGTKRSLALDLRQPEAQAIVRKLVKEADVLIENFRPGAMESWGLSPDALLELNPELIMLRISGYGQTGPYKDKPGFGVVAEAMGGLRHLSAEPGRLPVRVGVSIGDTLASLHGVIGILMALHEKQRSGLGQVIDVALYEAVFNCMESLLPEYSAFGAVRGPAGSALPGIAPSNAYLCKDGKCALIAGNGDSIFKRLMAAIGRDDLAADPALTDNAGRVKRVEEIDAAIGAWTSKHNVTEVLAVLDQAAVPAGRIYTVEDIAADPHYLARDMLADVSMSGRQRFESAWHGSKVVQNTWTASTQCA
jgi:formyl-CoA transferase